jgi:predicted ATPase with chaperone activity
MSTATASTWTSPTTSESPAALVSALGLDDSFLPEEPSTLAETGLSATFVEDLVIKIVHTAGSLTGKQISDRICLRVGILEDIYTELRKRQYLTLSGSGMLGDHIYQLTDLGRERARIATQECAYTGPAPVPLEDYVDSVQAQTIRTEKPKRDRLEKAFSDINVEPDMLAKLGPAISAGKGMFVYGPPGNGKTTIAQRITRCFGQNILVPHAIIEDGQIIKFFDASCHETVETAITKLINTSNQDRRWIRIRRPTVVVGGELTMDSLELKHDPVSHVSGASLQLKSNCGSLLIDDFGRQRINPTELLNRWIIPLENRIDFLTLANGKKIEVPFEQLIIFSTNLEPSDLADDAFLRRIPFKIEIGAPSRQEFVKLFDVFAKKAKLECSRDALEYLISQHYEQRNRPMRRCHARDLLDQVTHYCEYNELPKVATTEILDHAVSNYFTAMSGKE